MSNTNIFKVPVVKIKQVRQKSVTYNNRICAAENVVSMLDPIYRDIDREQFVVVGMNAQNFPNVVNIVSIGNLNSAPVCAREVFKPLILSNCLSFICVHNHVGGTLEPSNQDRNVTRMLMDVGKKLEIQLLDHIIIGIDGKYYSFANSGQLPVLTKEADQNGT